MWWWYLEYGLHCGTHLGQCAKAPGLHEEPYGQEYFMRQVQDVIPTRRARFLHWKEEEEEEVAPLCCRFVVLLLAVVVEFLSFLHSINFCHFILVSAQNNLATPLKKSQLKINTTQQ